MMNQMNKTLIVISVPFGRNSRFLLSSKIYTEIKKKYDVLIVSPFSNITNFQQEFGGPNVQFWKFDRDILQMNSWISTLFVLTETMRFNGYWCRFRNKKMQYYWNQIKEGYDELNLERKKSFKGRFLGILLGYIGYYAFSWKLIDKLFSGFFYDGVSFYKHIKQYKKVIVIQTANWDYQERFLAFCSNKYNCKKILVPYTTDQLTVNGYLINDYDMVCSQGPIESEFAIHHHKILESKLAKLGMLWLRNVDELTQELGITNNSINNKNRVILYAGVSASFFPRESEFEAIDRIVHAIELGTLTNVKLVYRPVISNDNERVDIENKYQHNSHITIQIPQLSCIGMSEFPITSTVKAEIIDYLKMISSINVLVMSSITTMFLDAYYFGVPVISNFTDPSMSLQKKGCPLLLDGDPLGIISLGMPVVHSFDDLILKIREALSTPSVHNTIEGSILERWDYNNNNYVDNFMKIIDEI